MLLKSHDGWISVRDVTWEAGYTGGIESRVMMKLLEELGVLTQRKTLPSGGQKALCIPEVDAEAVVEILKLRREENSNPARRAEIMAKARAAKKPDAIERAVQTRRERGWQKEKRREEAMCVDSTCEKRPHLAHKQLAPMPEVAQSPSPPTTTSLERRTTEETFEVTVRKLIALCARMNIDSITIQDGKAEIVRSVTVTKEETIKG